MSVRLENEEAVMKVVMRSFEMKIVSELGKNPITHRIAEVKRTSVPLKVLKTITSNMSVEAYQIKLQMPNVAKTSYMKDPVIIINEQLALPNHADEQFDEYVSLRELEDELSRKSVEESEQEMLRLFNQPFDMKLLEKFQESMDPALAEYGNLIDWYNRFNKVPGFQEILERIVINLHNASFNRAGNSIRGLLFELKCAYYISTQENEDIVSFRLYHESKKIRREFDILTASNRIIECKDSESAIKQDTITQQLGVAKYNNLHFELYVNSLLSKEMKAWLEANNIVFKEIA